MKKVLSLFLAMVFVLGVWASVPITANAASTSDLIFEYNQHDDTYMVTGCKKTISGALTIPDTYKGVPVTEVMAFAFANTAITSVVCGNNIRSLGGGAFYNCKKLTSAKLPDHQILIYHSYDDTVSPFDTELDDASEKPNTFPPNSIIAASKLNLVLVLGSKNKVANFLPSHL
jgi:hypothetical protein